MKTRKPTKNNQSQDAIFTQAMHSTRFIVRYSERNSGVVQRQPNIRSDQAGIVSIIVTMVLMVVITLIVITFGQLARREERQALDNQLSTQAYYAAESGVNDAVSVVQTALKNNTALPTPNTCYNGNVASKIATGADYNLPLDGASGVITYSCVTVNPLVDSIEYNSISPDNSKIVLIRDAANTAINSLTISWDDAGGNAPNLAGCNISQAAFPATLPANCNLGLIRAELVPVSGPVDRDALNNNDFVTFMVPNNNPANSGDVSYTPGYGSSGSIVQANCTSLGKRKCRAKITGLSAATQYYLRIRSLYLSTGVSITGTAGGSPVKFAGAQAVIDSTGKASDILHRIQVHVPITSNNSAIPEFGVQTAGNLCKRFSVIPPTQAVFSSLDCPYN